MKSYTFATQAQTQAWARALSVELVRPCVVLLSGDLGAGKTQLVRWVLAELGVSEAMSPTFAIYHRYQSASGLVDHADLYRLKSAEDLESSGFWDLLLEPRGLLFVEWADRLPMDVWPRHWKLVQVQIFKEKLDSEARRLELTIRLPF
jgi:tRNA threonylcarbamoyladenosine biosynthesis protein TsaE